MQRACLERAAVRPGALALAAAPWRANRGPQYALRLPCASVRSPLSGKQYSRQIPEPGLRKRDILS